MTEKLLKVNDVGELLDLKPARIYELCREKSIPFILIGQRQYRFSRTALQNWIDNGGNQTQTIENQCLTPFK